MARAGTVLVALGLVVVSALSGCSGSTDVAADPQSTTSAEPPSGASAGPSTGGTAGQSADQWAAGTSEPVEDPYYPDTSNPEIDVLHYQLDLDWDGRTLDGTVAVDFRVAESTDTTRLDLSRRLEVTSVDLDGVAVSSSQAGDGLSIATDQLSVDSEHTVVIDYTGRPGSTQGPGTRADFSEGLGWNADRDGTVHTFQEPYGAFTWYPVNDHPSDKALYDARITTHGSDVGVFNGTLESRRTGADTTTNTWHLDEPAASYLITIAIGPYREYTDTTPSGMALSYWLLPRDRGLRPRLEREGSKAYEWLLDHAGPFPFSSLGVVVVGGTSAMETQTLVTMSRGAVRRSDAVLEHELAHQWYGDSVSPSDWQGMWLNEGWAMYMQQWYESDTGRRVYAGGLDEWRLLDEQSRGNSGPPGDYDPNRFADLNVYLGPAMMLDRIRVKIGDAAFEQLAEDWPAEHENAVVDRDTFVQWVNQETEVDLTALIDTWLDSEHTPR